MLQPPLQSRSARTSFENFGTHLQARSRQFRYERWGPVHTQWQAGSPEQPRLRAEERQHESSIQPGRHPCSADEVAIDHDPCIHKNRSVIPHQIPSTPMRGHLSPRENACRTTNQRSGADRKQELFPLNVISDEAEHFFIVHQRRLPITAGHEQNIKDVLLQLCTHPGKVEAPAHRGQALLLFQ